MNRTILILGIITLFLSCKSTKLKKKSDFYMQNDSINLYAFIGQKISVTEFDANKNNTTIKINPISGDTIRHVTYIADNGFRSKYKVLKNVYNDLKIDTIDFVAYDHYGRPSFEKYENVILYLSFNKKERIYYHQKYQYDPVKKTKNGMWQGLNGKSIEQLFNEKKKDVFKARRIFE